VIPPRWLARICTRAGAKLAVCLWLAVRARRDWIMGFHFVPHGFNARVVGALTGTKSLYHMIGGESEWAGGGWDSENRVLGRQRRPSPALERIFFRLIKGCTAVATMGEASRAALVERGLDAARVRVIPPSVDASRFHATEGSSRRYDIVTVGRLAPRKRTADLLRAVAELRRLRPAVTAAVAGDGPLASELGLLAEELGIADCVDFLGFRGDVEDVYASARVFVLTSESEGLPISMLEAMSASLPCVLPAVGEIPGVVVDGESGFLFDPGDIETLVGRLDMLLGDESLQAALGAGGARLARDIASIAAVARRYQDLFAATAARAVAR
jgi:glycosyltransferase involved in cell wall biosynthesis